MTDAGTGIAGRPRLHGELCETVALVLGGEAARRDVVIETDRLVLRPWQVQEAAVRRELWSERDARVPPHRRIDAEGRPTVEDLAESIREERSASLGLLAIERRADGDVIGCCGLVDGDRGPAEPELAFELLRRTWHHGYATEAATAVLDWAGSTGLRWVWADVWEWNHASRRVLAKVGFTETARRDVGDQTTLVLSREL